MCALSRASCQTDSTAAQTQAATLSSDLRLEAICSSSKNLAARASGWTFWGLSVKTSRLGKDIASMPATGLTLDKGAEFKRQPHHWLRQRGLAHGYHKLWSHLVSDSSAGDARARKPSSFWVGSEVELSLDSP